MARPARAVAHHDDQGGSPRLHASTEPVDVLRDAQRAAIDLLFFAPIGFAKRARSLLPDLIREGRSTAASARTIGKFVTPIARTQGTKLVKAKVAELTGSAIPKKPAASRSTSESTQARRAVAPTDKVKLARPSTARSTRSKGSSTPHEPFAGYDHLGSAAVVARLGELSKADRAAVRAYEEANRNRRTVLGRLDQLDPSR